MPALKDVLGGSDQGNSRRTGSCMTKTTTVKWVVAVSISKTTSQVTVAAMLCLMVDPGILALPAGRSTRHAHSENIIQRETRRDNPTRYTRNGTVLLNENPEFIQTEIYNNTLANYYPS